MCRSVGLQILSAEGSSDERSMRKPMALCDASFLALCDGIGIFEYGAEE